MRSEGYKLKAAIFDLDGTLLNTIDDLADAGNYALTQNGFRPHPVGPYKFFVGDGIFNLIRRALPEGSRDEATILRVKRDFDEYYAAHSQDKTKPYDGIVDALRELKEKGVRIAIFSNKPHEHTIPVVAHYLPGIAEPIFGQREGVPVKPDPATVFEILDIWGLPKQDVCYIGDTGTDMRTGKSAGLFTIGVLWGFRTKEELEENGADILITHPNELIKLMTESEYK